MDEEFDTSQFDDDELREILANMEYDPNTPVSRECSRAMNRARIAIENALIQRRIKRALKWRT